MLSRTSSLPHGAAYELSAEHKEALAAADAENAKSALAATDAKNSSDDDDDEDEDE
jgi:hypothetical protein